MRIRIFLIIAFAALPRFIAAIWDHSIFWPDEIYQTLEPAHRLVFGKGLLPWEFRDGARSWFLPGIYAGIWQSAAWLGIESPLIPIVTARLLTACLSLAAIWIAIRSAETIDGADAGILTGIIAAWFPPYLFFSHRCLSETMSAPLIALLIHRAVKPTPTAASSGILAGAAWIVRYQNALVGASLAIVLAFRRRWKSLLIFLASAAAVASAGGLLDFWTWGELFHSLRTYIEFNLLESGADSFGTAPPTYYLTSLWTATGWAAPILLPAAILGIVRAPVAGIVVVFFIAIHSFVPHKELRFIIPVLPTFCMLSGLGLSRILRRIRSRIWFWVAAVVPTVLCAFQLAAMTPADMGSDVNIGKSKSESIWTGGDINLALATAGRKTDLCGLGVMGVNAFWSGGYSYFHNDSPLLYRDSLCGWEASVNYVLAPSAGTNSSVLEGYVKEYSNEAYVLYRRPGGCAPPPPDFTGTLPGADEMGLHRPWPSQPDVHRFAVDAGRGCGCFADGWGPPELAGCRSVRWAVSNGAMFLVDLNPLNSVYELRFTALVFEKVMPQVARISLNGFALTQLSFQEGWRTYRLEIPRQAMKVGRNEFDFRFSKTFRPDVKDPTQFAALFDDFSVVPRTDDERRP